MALNTKDLFGIKSGNSRVSSKTLISITDLLSEGQIDGIVSKEYILAGVAYGEGWSDIEQKHLVESDPQNAYLASVYLNDVPILGRDGQFNFQDVQFSKTEGFPNGNSSTAQEIKKTIPINERLRGPNFRVNVSPTVLIGSGDQFAKFYKILNKDCTAIEVNVKIGSLSYVDRTNPLDVKITDSRVNYSIYYRPLYVNSIPDAFQLAKSVVVEGRIASPYLESTRVDFSRGVVGQNGPNSDSNFLGWEIKISRSTQDSIDADTQNSSSIESISEILSSRYAYPNSATTSVTFDAEYFSQIPTRSYDTRLLKVKIPTNYDPLRKIYSGIWDGSFQTAKAWTDNPAWCFYDLATNSRYGLGKYIESEYVDKWTLYEIAKYCDVLVPDGFNGIEPRFTCNLILQSREEAYKVINDMTSIFRGISYYAAGNIYVNQDNDRKRPIYQFTNANVEDGEFLYASSSSKLRHNVAIVRYNDKSNFFKPAIELVEDIDGIRKNGIKEIELAAFGCTSRGQANRLGRWVLFTENLETETVAFTAGLEANYLRPGDVVTVSDQNKNVIRRGGRLSGFDSSAKTLTLDSAILGINTSNKYCLSILTPSFSFEPSLVGIDYSDKIPDIRRSHVQNFYIQGAVIRVETDSTVISLSDNFPSVNGYSLLPDAVWTISLSGHEPGKPFPNADSIFDSPNFYELSSKNETFRVLSVEESESNKYKISAIEYNPLKFIAIESGLSFDVSYSTVMPSPANSVTFSALTNIGNSVIINYTINSNEIQASLTALSTYLVYVKSSPSASSNPWIKGDYQLSNPSLAGLPNDTMVGHAGELSLLPNPRYKIATLAAHSSKTVSAKFAPSETEVYYFFKVFATNASAIHSNGVAGLSEKITNNFPIRDISIKNLRLSTDIKQINNAGTKDGLNTEFKSHSPVFQFEIAFTGAADKLTNLSSNFSYRITFRDPANSSSVPSTTVFRQITGFYAPDSVSPSFEYPFSGNYSDNNKVPKRKFDVVVEAHDANGNSSAGDNFVLKNSSNFTYSNPNGYDILQVDNPKPSNFILTEPGEPCLTTDDYCTEQYWEYDRDLKIIFNKIHSSISDSAGGFIYAASGEFDPQFFRGKSKEIANASGIEVIEFTKFENPISARPAGLTNDSAPHIFMAYSLYDSFDKEWKDLAAANNDTVIKLDERASSISNLARAIRPEIRYFNGEGYKAWVLIDLEREGSQGLPYIKTFGIRSIQILDIYDGINNTYEETQNVLCALPANHPYKSFRGIRRAHCNNAQTHELYGTAIYRPGSLTFDSVAIQSYYCGFSRPRDNGVMDEMVITDYMKSPTTQFDSHTKWTRFRCYFDTDKTTPPVVRQGLIPLEDSSPTDYNKCYSAMSQADARMKYVRYKGDYHIVGDNINNAKYPAINSTKMANISSMFHLGAGNTYNGVLNAASFPEYSDILGYNPHPAGFGQGYGGLEKNQRYFDVHMGRLVDGGVLTTALFGVVWTQ